jgi:hypothetical protein
MLEKGPRRPEGASFDNGPAPGQHISPPLTISGEKKKKRSCEKLASFCITYLIGEHHLFVQFSSIPFNTAMKANIACVLLALAVSSGKLYSCPNFSFVTTNCLSMFDFFIISLYQFSIL